MIAELRRRVERIEATSAPPSEPRWFDLKRACAKKGVSYNTLASSANAWLRPNGGEPDTILNNRHHWHLDTVLEWCELGDAELARRYRRDSGVA